MRKHSALGIQDSGNGSGTPPHESAGTGSRSSPAARASRIARGMCHADVISPTRPSCVPAKCRRSSAISSAVLLPSMREMASGGIPKSSQIFAVASAGESCPAWRPALGRTGGNEPPDLAHVVHASSQGDAIAGVVEPDMTAGPAARSASEDDKRVVGRGLERSRTGVTALDIDDEPVADRSAAREREQHVGRKQCESPPSPTAEQCSTDQNPQPKPEQASRRNQPGHALLDECAAVDNPTRSQDTRREKKQRRNPNDDPPPPSNFRHHKICVRHARSPEKLQLRHRRVKFRLAMLAWATSRKPRVSPRVRCEHTAHRRATVFDHQHRRPVRDSEVGAPPAFVDANSVWSQTRTTTSPHRTTAPSSTLRPRSQDGTPTERARVGPRRQPPRR